MRTGDPTLNWGILGTGSIAGAFAGHLPHSTTGRLVAVGSRTRDSAERFAAKYSVPTRHATYEALLADDSVDAIYISTPHPMHAEWAIKCAQAKKHVLCEKPIGLNHAEAMAIVEAARENDVFLMEAYMYRCTPQTRRLVQLVRDERAVGDVRVIRATFSFHWPIPFNVESRLTNNALGGGGILDVGGYPMSVARLIAGTALGRDFAEPIEVKATGFVGPRSRVDEWTVASLRFDGGILAQLACGVQCNQEQGLWIYGSEGCIYVPKPFAPARDGGSSRIVLTRGNDPPREIVIDSPMPLYAIEADDVAANIVRRQSPSMSWDDTLGNMLALDRWRAQIGMTYDSEKPENFPHPPNLGRTPRPSRSAMKYATVAGVDKPISRLVMGCDNQRDFPHAAVMFDDFFARGGNAFDTAHIYHGGHQERLLGQWMTLRGVREQVVVIAKGAHSPNCNPRSLVEQLEISLERMQIDHADIYLMHRDNPRVPVGEFVDVLNELRSAGRIRAFGGSNWTAPRVQEANDYARERGRTPISLVSNQFSLARMVEPPWAGCYSANESDFTAWLAREQMPLLAWSSQSRGFFVPGRARPDKRDDAELVRCWYSDDNFQRLHRAHELAEKRGVLPINIALAYVLAQPFPTLALIGPRSLQETRTSWPALDVELSPEEVAWLNLQ